MNKALFCFGHEIHVQEISRLRALLGQANAEITLLKKRLQSKKGSKGQKEEHADLSINHNIYSMDMLQTGTNHATINLVANLDTNNGDPSSEDVSFQTCICFCPLCSLESTLLRSGCQGSPEDTPELKQLENELRIRIEKLNRMDNLKVNTQNSL